MGNRQHRDADRARRGVANDNTATVAAKDEQQIADDIPITDDAVRVRRHERDDALGPSRPLAIGVVVWGSRVGRPRWTPMWRAGVCLVLVVAGGTTTRLQAQTRRAPLTFDAALVSATQDNADFGAAGRQWAIREAQRARDAARVRGQALAHADCAPTCTSVVTPVDRCAAGTSEVLTATTGGVFTDSTVAAAAQTLRRNLREAFYDLLLQDEEIRVAEGVVDFRDQLRMARRARSDTDPASQLDTLHVELALSRAKLDLMDAQSRRRLAELAFNAILNRAPDVPVVLIGHVEEPIALPRVDPAILLAKMVDVPLRRLRHDLDVERRARASAPAVAPRPGSQRKAGLAGRGTVDRDQPSSTDSADRAPRADTRLVQLNTAHVARARAVEGCLRDAFARIDIGRRAATRLAAALTAATERVERTADEFLAGQVALSQLSEAERTLGDLRRDYHQVLHDLRLCEADIEARLPASGIPV